MSVTTSTDPVQTILDLLTNTTDSDWSNAGAKPPIIELQQDSKPKTKQNRSQDAVYCWSPAEGTVGQFDFDYDRYRDSQVVNIDCWTTTSPNHAADLSGDVRSIMLGYVNDNYSATAWGRIRPETENDLRHEAPAGRAGHYRIITLVRLEALRAP